MITPAQLRAARALLDWSQQELAQRAGLGLSTVRDFEAGRRLPTAASLDALRRVLDAAEIELILDAAGSEGVTLRRGAGARLYELVSDVTRLALEKEAPDERVQRMEARWRAMLHELRQAYAGVHGRAAQIRSALRQLEREVTEVKSCLTPEDSVRALFERLHELVRQELSAEGGPQDASVSRRHRPADRSP
jgi:transcriptional regulator with XRE-family HTH domain